MKLAGFCTLTYAYTGAWLQSSCKGHRCGGGNGRLFGGVSDCCCQSEHPRVGGGGHQRRRWRNKSRARCAGGGGCACCGVVIRSVGVSAVGGLQTKNLHADVNTCTALARDSIGMQTKRGRIGSAHKIGVIGVVPANSAEEGFGLASCHVQKTGVAGSAPCQSENEVFGLASYHVQKKSLAGRGEEKERVRDCASGFFASRHSTELCS